MPRAKSKATINKPTETKLRAYACPEDAGWGGFLNVRMSESDKEEFGAWWAENVKRVPSFLDDAMIEGMKVSLAYDTENQCYIVTFTGRLLSNSMDRCAASSRAGTLDECIALMVYKHVVMAQGQWDNFKPKSSTFMSWG